VYQLSGFHCSDGHNDDLEAAVLAKSEREAFQGAIPMKHERFGKFICAKYNYNVSTFINPICDWNVDMGSRSHWKLDAVEPVGN
jgi:hypothetical protein